MIIKSTIQLKMEDDKIIKIILLGESGVGKTNLIQVALDQPFQKEKISTLISSYYESEIIIQNKKYVYTLWDTAGQEVYRSLNKSFIKDSKIVILVFAINNRKSFEEIDYWMNSVKESLEENKYIMALVANKSDLFDEQEIPDEEIMKKGKELNIKTKITSAAEDSVGFKMFLEELLKDFVKSGIPFEKKKTFNLEWENVEKTDEEKNNNELDNNRNVSNARNKKKKCC